MTNLRILRKSRKREPGDVFTYQLSDLRFGFGLLVRDDALFEGDDPVEGPTGMYLIYIYNAFADSSLTVPSLTKDNLLLPPLLTDRTPWTHGYFERIAHWPLTSEVCFNRHCFFDRTYSKPSYFDEYGRRLPKRFEPCGDFWIHSCFTIDQDICKALGLRVNDDDPRSLPGVRK